MIPIARMDEITTDEWKHLRRTGIGGSDAATLMGANKYRDPFCVYVDKVCDELAPDLTKEAVYWGTVLEPVVAAEFEKRTGYEVVKPSSLFRSSTHPFMLGSFDRFVLDPKTSYDYSEFKKGVPLDWLQLPSNEARWAPIAGILEIKTTGSYYLKQWESGVPEYPYAQLQHYLAVAGISMGWVACLVGGQRFIYHEVPSNPRFIMKMINVEHDFWRQVEAREAPTPDPTVGDVLEAIERLDRHTFLETNGLRAEPTRLAETFPAEAQPLATQSEPLATQSEPLATQSEHFATVEINSPAVPLRSEAGPVGLTPHPKFPGWSS